jgi:hypothetical protein
MARLLRSIVALAACLSALPGAAAEPGDPFAPSERVSVETEATLDANVSELLIFSSARGASLYIDRSYVATLPVSGGYSGKVSTGSHLFELVVPGYYDLGQWFMLEEKTKYTISFDPLMITGFLSIEVEPADASILIDGAETGGGLLELPVGERSLRASRFGYADRSLALTIREKETQVLSLSLDHVPLEIRGLVFSRAAFSPRNAGAPGRSSLDFRASSFGSARAEIRGPDGALVATLDYPDFETWNQSRAWEGLRPDGSALPDGIYTASLFAKPPSGEEYLAGKAEARIDSSLVLRTAGIASALPGLLYMPDPIVQPDGTIAAEASWFAPFGALQDSAFGLSAALSIGGKATIAIQAAAETGGTATSGDLALSCLASLFGEGAFGGALFLRGNYGSAPSPTMPGARSALEASFPISARLGVLSLALSPGLLVDLESSSPGFLGLARAGLWLEGRSFRAGVSGELPLSFVGGLPSPLWPARTALEGRLALGSTPLVAAAYLGAELSPGSAPELAIGVGLGLLF